MSLWERIRFQASSYNPGSVTNKLRKQRMAVLEKFVLEHFGDAIRDGRKVKVLDIGGTYRFWKAMEFPLFDSLDLTLLNIERSKLPEPVPNMQSVEGDATDLAGVADKAYDLVFSNSCIEHVGREGEWQKMADEMRRVGRHYFLQTPNRYFPVEPHFLFPFFQFFPVWLKAVFIRSFELGFWPQGKDWQDSLKIAREITLLRQKDLRRLFPEATIARERVGGFTKSFMVYH